MRSKQYDSEPTNQALTLLELNSRIRAALNHSFPDTYWVRAEMSDVRVNARRAIAIWSLSRKRLAPDSWWQRCVAPFGQGPSGS